VASGTVITRLIERLGYRPTLCADPFQAIALVYANDYALMVTDLAMPGLPGDELALQALRRKPGLPVLLISGFIEPEKLERLRRLGVREIVGKPPAYEELAAALHRCLRG
jgi:CheY-like chemotaxis protein